MPAWADRSILYIPLIQHTLETDTQITATKKHTLDKVFMLEKASQPLHIFSGWRRSLE